MRLTPSCRPCPSGGMVDAADSKSVARKGVLVRVRPGAPFPRTWTARFGADVDRCSFTLSDLQLYLLPGSPAHATPYKGGVAFKIAPNPGLNLSAVEPDVLQFEV